MQEKRRNPRNTAVLLDVLHIVIGILVVICAVLACLGPEQNQILFPVIFWLAAALNGVNAWFGLADSGRDKKKKTGALALGVMAAVLFGLGVVSAVSIWR